MTMEAPQYIQAPSAFTTVSARRSFHHAPPPPPPTVAPSTQHANPATEKAKRDWPEPVRAYVQRSFAVENSDSRVTLSEMQEKLKSVISQSAENNTLSSLDWEHMPLPQQMILQERAAAMMMSNISINTPPPWQQKPMPHFPQDTNPRTYDSPSKKRKSSEMDHSGEKIPPWRQNATHNVFEDRLSFADKRQRQDGQVKLSKSEQKLANRKRRFEDAKYASATARARSPTPEVDRGPVIGRCQDLEKKYFRLTSAPNPDTVRPLPVLKQTLELLKTKWKKEKNYSYICDQFKSLRQDLTVQHIKTEFTVKVYESHAYIALEKGDLGEYNQCQTQLRALYSQRLGGHPEEFKAYRILYFIHTCNRTDMNDLLADLTPAEKANEVIKHALATRSALALGNYHRFFKLYLETPKMGAFLIDMFVSRERLVALSNICVAYKQEVSLRFVTDELGFGGDDECAKFICEHGGDDFLYMNDAGEIKLRTARALRFFDAAKNAAFRKVDIKGQI